MPDQPPEFSPHQALEADIERLAAEVKKHRELPESKTLGDREIVRQALTSMTGMPPPNTAVDSAAVSSPLPAYMAASSSETKLEVEYLIDVAFHKGIEEAVKESRASKNPFVFDALHDALAGKLYSELERRGIVT